MLVFLECRVVDHFNGTRFFADLLDLLDLLDLVDSDGQPLADLEIDGVVTIRRPGFPDQVEPIEELLEEIQDRLRARDLPEEVRARLRESGVSELGFRLPPWFPLDAGEP